MVGKFITAAGLAAIMALSGVGVAQAHSQFDHKDRSRHNNIHKVDKRDFDKRDSDRKDKFRKHDKHRDFDKQHNFRKHDRDDFRKKDHSKRDFKQSNKRDFDKHDRKDKHGFQNRY